MKTRLKEFAYSSPMWTAIEIALFAVILFSLPNALKLGETAEFILHIICRALAVICAFVLAKILNFKLFTKTKISLAEIFVLLLGFLVCVNNFPIIGFIKGNVYIFENAKIFRYIIYCIMIGVAEEFVFRGLIMPLVGCYFKSRKRAPLITVAISSLIFSLCHLFNIFSQGIVPTLLQIGYTFLTGGLFGIVCFITENLVFPIILHIVFDLGGLMFSSPFGIAAGNMWDVLTIIITAALSVFATAVYFVKVYNYKKADS